VKGIRISFYYQYCFRPVTTYTVLVHRLGHTNITAGIP